MIDTKQLIGQFQDLFPQSTPTHLIRAPGRVNLIGEHIDYNDGFVLPMALQQALYIVVGPGDSDRVTVHTTAFEQTADFSATNPGPAVPPDHSPTGPAWLEYVRGVAALLQSEEIELTSGCLLIGSDVPVGGGVSSSAALEVGSALALLSLAQADMAPVDIALLAQKAEHQYAHSPCGIMDQFICALARADHALLLDCQSQQYDHIPVGFDQCSLLVIDTQVKHNLGASEYPLRQKQCSQGLAMIRQAYPQTTSFRQVTEAMLRETQKNMNDVAFRRCRHVVSEIERTIKAAQAMREGDAHAFGRLMANSHISLRDDYQVSCPELDALVEIGTRTAGVYGIRMTGGGFGGCAVALVDRNVQDKIETTIAEQYNRQFDKPAIIYTSLPAAGATVIPIED